MHSRIDQHRDQGLPAVVLFGLTKTVILMFTGLIGAALFFFGHGRLELVGMIVCATAFVLGLISLWFYLSEKASSRFMRQGKTAEARQLSGFKRRCFLRCTATGSIGSKDNSAPRN